MAPRSRLYNADLAPVPPERRTWGAFAIFNVWSNTAQSLFGYTLVATLFVTSGLSGWLVFVAMMLAGVVIAVLVNLSGRPSTRYGIPYPVMARAAMGVYGANAPAMLRAVVAIFWYGAQTWFAASAMALALQAIVGAGPPGRVLGLALIDWVALVAVSLIQIVLFYSGMNAIRRFINLAAPIVYVMMLAILVAFWILAGPRFWSELAVIFEGTGHPKGGTLAAFVFVTGTMIASYSPVILNFGDFSRHVGSVRQMVVGNYVGLVFNMTFFALLALFLTAGARVVFGETITDPVEMLKKVDEPALTIVASLTFFLATMGVNVVANFVAPANDISHLFARHFSFRTGGLIAAAFAFVVSALWVSVISEIGIDRFVNTLGSVMAPAYGILVADYYLVRRGEIVLDELYETHGEGRYHYRAGWNLPALGVLAVAGVVTVAGVWWKPVAVLGGFDWVMGAALGGALYVAVMRRVTRRRA